MRISVLGGGSWGTALAHLLATNSHNVTILLREVALADAITHEHANTKYLPNLTLHPKLTATTDAKNALSECDICLSTIPSQHTRTVLTSLAPFLPKNALLVSASKGIEQKTLCCMHEIVAQVLPHHAPSFSILSGPSFAKEVILGKPTAVVLASPKTLNEAVAKNLRATFSNTHFRVYSSTDVLGVELGGALKNIIALAAGMSDGLGLGDNARGALITRGLAEITRLGIALGAQPTTFMGLSGLGDLVLTCAGDLSRNRQVGLRLGQGESLQNITASMHNIVEGITTTDAAYALGKKLHIELPITESIHRIVHEQANLPTMVQELMTRSLKEE